jgi:hypothetical protein
MNRRDKIWLTFVICSLVGWAFDGLRMHSETVEDKVGIKTRLRALDDPKTYQQLNEQIAWEKRSLARGKRWLENAKSDFESVDSARIREILPGE